MFLVLTEALAIALFGGLLGILGALIAVPALGGACRDAAEHSFHVRCFLSDLLAIFAGFASGVIPGVSAMRLRVVNASGGSRNAAQTFLGFVITLAAVFVFLLGLTILVGWSRHSLTPSPCHNFRSIRARWTSTIVAVLGIAGTVGVFVAMLSLAKGFKSTLVASGSAGMCW